MPDLVAHGRKPAVLLRLLPLAQRPGPSRKRSLAGQPAAYILEAGDGNEGRPPQDLAADHGSIKAMDAIAAAANAEEIKIAADYFSKLHYKKWIRVVEAGKVPKFEISSHNMLVKAKGDGTEALGMRIAEMPENLDRVELRDPSLGFVAYVPKGAIAKGRKLVESGNGAFPCASCHGADLKGSGDVPALAGRSPSGIVRQLYDIQHGTRTGPAVIRCSRKSPP